MTDHLGDRTGGTENVSHAGLPESFRKCQWFDRRSGLAILVVWNQRLGDGGPDFPQMEPTDQLDAPNRRFPESRVTRFAKRRSGHASGVVHLTRVPPGSYRGHARAGSRRTRPFHTRHEKPTKTAACAGIQAGSTSMSAIGGDGGARVLSTRRSLLAVDGPMAPIYARAGCVADH